MDVVVDQLESLWPSYRGANLLGAARESQGRVCNAGIAVTAGHVSLSLDVHPVSAFSTGSATSAARSISRRHHKLGDDTPSSAPRLPPPPPPPTTTTTTTTTTAAAITTENDGTIPPPACLPAVSRASLLRLTVLLDAVPASAPKPGTKQMARFLTKVLARNSLEEAVFGGGGDRLRRRAAKREEGSLGADVPEILVVEHTDEVVCSEFVRFDHRRHTSFGSTSTEGGSDSSGLAYACIEASGLLRLWEWGGTESGRWSWSYLNSCNICSCREDPAGCRVLTATIVPEPDNDDGRDNVNGKGGNRRRHRLVWEQEDSGEGAGLGLASTPATGPLPPRRVWSRRVTFDLPGGAFGNEQQQQQQQQQQHQTVEEDHGAAFDGGRNSTRKNTRSEISLAFSACLLPTGVNALLCSRQGAWMPAGTRVYFNHFATGRLPCIALPSPLVSEDRGSGRVFEGTTSAEGADGGCCGLVVRQGAGTGDTDAGTDLESSRGIGGSELGQDGGFGRACDEDEGSAAVRAEQTEAFPTETTTGGRDGGARGTSSSAAARRLFAVHESTGDLMLYDHQPLATVRALSLPSGAGGLKLRLQCTLDPPPPRASPPGSFAACSNVAVLCGGGLCSVYDLCTGRLLGAAVIPRCPACNFRRRHRSRTDTATPAPSGLVCTCGRRQQQHQGVDASGLLNDGPSIAAAAAAAASPALWTSETRGHLVGVITATQVLRVGLPTLEACLAASLTLSSRSRTGGSSCPSSAPSTLWYLREHRRLVGGTAAGGNGALPASLAPELLWMVQRDPGNGNGDDNDDADDSAAKKGTAMMDLIGHTLTAQERGRSATAAAAPVVADGDGNRSRQEAPVPPWLLLAMVSAAHSQERRGLSAADPSEAAGAVLEGPPSRSRGGGDPATAAVEGGVRSALEWRVAESLRSLSNVRALLQDPVAAAAAAERAGSTSRSIADDEAARKLEALTAAVDPATALFEGTLREWLACRRSGKKEGGELYSGDAWAGESVNLAGGGRGGGGELCGPGSERAAAAVAVDGGGSRTMPDNALALAFRCEAAGVREAMEIPFLHFLFEASGDGGPGRPTPRGGGGGKGTDREGNDNDGSAAPPYAPARSSFSSSSSSSSTFLCLYLAGDDKSPLFEIACRALFRLRPRELPRFVERLARFRAYAEELRAGGEEGEEKAEGGQGGAEAAEPSPQMLDGVGEERKREAEEEEDEGEVLAKLFHGGQQGPSVSSTDIGSERMLEEEPSVNRSGGGGGRSDSPASFAEGRQRAHRSLSPLQQISTASRRTSDDNASDTGGRVSRATTRANSAETSREQSPEQAAPPSPARTVSTDPPFQGATNHTTNLSSSSSSTAPAAGTAARQHRDGGRLRKNAPPVAPVYFARALACLPPAAEDDKTGDSSGSRQRSARLSLLLGACMFTEASRLLCSRAWGSGSSGSSGGGGCGSGIHGGWRGNRGAAEAWGAAMRLLNKLSQAAAAAAAAAVEVTGDEGDDVAAAAAAAAAASSAAAASAPTAVAGAAVADPPVALAVTALVPPPSLQFRLAFEDALAEAILADSPERMEEVMLCRPAGLTPVAVVRMVRRAAKAVGVGGSDEAESCRPLLSSSTRTLKLCLLLLLGDGAMQGAAPAM
ncbi:unnamed protein product [Pylaiella littoralis]